MSIIAQSADGAEHEFPDGTDPAIVDRAMKQYAAAKVSQPALMQQPMTMGHEMKPDPFIPAAIRAAGHLMGFGDEFVAAGDALIPGSSLASEGRTFQDRYLSNVAKQRAQDAANAKRWPVTNFIGNVAGDTLGAAAAGVPAVTTYGGAALTGAGMGALGGLGQATGPLQERLPSAAMGGAVGAVAGPAVKAVGDVIAPQVSKAVRALSDAGVKMTPGQMAGGFGKWAEDVGESVPGLGFLIKQARNQSVGSLNTAIADDALEHIGENVPGNIKPGFATNNYVADKFSNAYGDLLSRMSGNADNQLLSDVSSTVAAAKQKLGPELGDQIERLASNEIIDRVSPSGTYDGETLKGIQSELSKALREYQKSPGYWEKGAAGFVGDLKDAFESMLERTNPDDAAELGSINAGYAKALRLFRATESAGAKEGIATPNALANAIRAMESNKRNISLGQGLGQDLASAAQKVLPKSIADSGSAERGLAILAAEGVLGHAALPQALPAMAIPALTYTQPGLAVSRAYFLGAPGSRAAVAAALRGTIPGVAATAGGMAPKPVRQQNR